MIYQEGYVYHIKDEYFDANNEKGYYEFNQVGKDTVQSLINDLRKDVNKLMYDMTHHK